MHPQTQCVHSGSYRDPATRGLNTPIFTSSAYAYLDREQTPYPRYFNTPNQEAVVRKLCALEGAEGGVLFASGMAAMSTAILAFAGAGDHVVLMDELYGGTHAFATDEFARLGIACTFAGTGAEALCAAVTPRTRVMVVESPTNPLLSVVDLRRVAAFARERGVVTVVDNTFATPLNQNPLSLGIDVVVHSGTKYLGGHSDLCCGAVLAAAAPVRRVLALARHLGGSLDAQACYLLERSLKTLALRVERQSANALALAQFLESHPSVARTHYPGLPESPGHALACTQMRGFGGMLAFELRAGAVPPARFVRALALIAPALSLGGVETTICAPAETSHAKMSAEERRRIGIGEGLFRLSVGIEHVEDLVADLEQALKAG